MYAPAHIGTLASRICLGLAAAGVSVALLGAPAAFADPAAPVDPVPPTAVPADTGTQAIAAGPAVAPVAVPHLSSPDNLPPGTTDTPPEGRLNYLRDLWHAIRTQDVSGSDALLLLAQRPLDANATPPPGMAAGPTGPVGSSAVAPPAAGPATP
ncbi:dopamine receptor D4 [Mycolicibacterium sp. CH28]|nr:dopamine receptor D4 [Mycolicibacterium sp. CH28]TGD84996.1 dopamine receptor D4 [Mycolicibacterium sp. CH28]